jgi:predicted aspartyl protease
LVAGCATLGRNTVVIHESAGAQLATRVKEGLFLANARIGHHEAGPFVIDTGATHIVLDVELAKKLNPSLARESGQLAIKQKVRWGALASLEVGPMTFQNTDVVVMDLSFASAQFGERLAGFLGHPFFAKAVVEVDYATGSITCKDPKTYRLPRGEWLPLSFKTNRPIITARLEGNIEGQFVLDTGETGTVLFYPDFVRNHALLDKRETIEHTVRRVDGLYRTRAAKIAWFELAGRRFEQLVVQFAPSELPKAGLEGVAGIIGRGLLRRFTVIFNYSESRIALLQR